MDIELSTVTVLSVDKVFCERRIEYSSILIFIVGTQNPSAGSAWFVLEIIEFSNVHNKIILDIKLYLSISMICN